MNIPFKKIININQVFLPFNARNWTISLDGQKKVNQVTFSSYYNTRYLRLNFFYKPIFCPFKLNSECHGKHKQRKE
jgi:hypothetical protein